VEDLSQLKEGVIGGEVRLIGRAISLIEDNPTQAKAILRLLYPYTGKAFILGITGPPGSGKSTLVDKLTPLLRQQKKKVGIIAIDPTSPYSGGAVLGDRIRMQELTGDEGVFIRSMATRGSLGGLSRATDDAVAVLDASGKDVIIIETVGVGQAEVDIVSLAHGSIVVLSPELGDDIQAIKAGIIEIADILVINKVDKGGYERIEGELRLMWEQFANPQGWKPRIVKTTAVRGEGIEELIHQIDSYHQFFLQSETRQKKMFERSERRLQEIIQRYTLEKIYHKTLSQQKRDEYIRKIANREIDPYTAVEEILRNVKL